MQKIRRDKRGKGTVQREKEKAKREIRLALYKLERIVKKGLASELSKKKKGEGCFFG